MTKKFLLFKIWIIIIFFTNAAWCADKISGSACYTYGDNESLVQAEQMTKTLAIRNAIESYSIFIESTSTVRDLQLSSDLINTVSAGQVKKVKVIKRLESGRKLCYTIKGFVEPKELKMEINKYLIDKKNISNVRLQENGWIRIVDHFVANLTPEEFYRVSSDDHLAKTMKDKIFRILYIKIEFLKPCVANTMDEEIRDESERRLKAGLPFSTEGQALLMLGLVGYAKSKAKTESEKQDAKEAYTEFKEFCTKNGIDPNQFVMDVSLPRYRCDYRNKVFASFYSAAGHEIETRGQFPIAYWIDSNRTKRKIEMLPGETTFVSLYITDETKTWKVWVPK